MYVVAEDLGLLGFRPHLFESFAQFQDWAKDNPRHGPIVARPLATMSKRPVMAEIDHRPARQGQDANRIARGD